MKQFFKFVFASCLGLFLALAVLFLIFGVFLGSKVSKAIEGDTVEIKANSILKLKLDQIIPEKTDNVPVNFMDLESDTKIGVSDIIKMIKKAKTDDNIKGIYMNNSSIGLGQAGAYSIRQALIDFKNSGKFIISYNTHYGQAAYYLASVADQVLIDPMGEIELKGYASTIPHFKDMMDRLGIGVQVVYAGQFKSATEPFRLNKMSDQNKLQTRELLNSLYKNLITGISESRKISIDNLSNIITQSPYHQADKARQEGLVDSLVELDDIDAYLKTKVGLDDAEDLSMVMISDYLKANRLDKNNSADDKIAVVYAEGSITEAKSEEETNISGKEYVNIFDKIEKDKKIKAVVLRINSPGGSAVASEQILQAINDLKKIKKIPVIVSMGDVAASGGYYIACQADKIYAEPNTITGSIGVFGMIPDVSKLMETKLGIHFDTVKTAPLAEGVTGVFPMSKPTLDYFQRDVDRVYDVFLSRVAKGRNKSKEEIHTIAQGRIWTGNMAKNNGLVDEIGSLEDAVLYASTKANIKNYKITEYPKIKDPINRLIDKYVNKKENETKANIKALSGDAYFIFDALTQIQQWNGVQARLPFMLNKF